MLINVHLKYKRYVPIIIEVCASKSELRDRCERADLFVSTGSYFVRVLYCNVTLF